MGQRPAVMAAWLKTEVYTVQGGPGGPDTKKRVGREQEGGWRPVEGVLEGRRRQVLMEATLQEAGGSPYT